MGKKKWPNREKGKFSGKALLKFLGVFFNQKGGYYEQDDRCMGNFADVRFGGRHGMQYYGRGG
jgi:hypothetical protein